MFKQILLKIKEMGLAIIDVLTDPASRDKVIKVVKVSAVIIIIVFLVLIWWWDSTLDLFDPVENAQQMAAERQQNIVTGYISTATLIRVSSSLLDKPGGYLSNDIMPPSVWLDNMPNWEFGVLVQVRDYARTLRNDISRSQSQSLEDPDLAIVEPLFNFDAESWMLPPSEGEYGKAIKALESYLGRLGDTGQESAQFYARADNLADWLAIVEKRLGSLSQRLSASVGQVRVNTDLAGDPAAQQSTPEAKEMLIKTPWLEIDNVFYEARGTTWALIHLLKAAESDFEGILAKKHALVSLRQIIRELESTQDQMWSPVILNGSGFGLFANHSLVMASYISRANAAIIDLRLLLSDG